MCCIVILNFVPRLPVLEIQEILSTPLLPAISSNRFQSGAIEFATSKKIAPVTFVYGSFLYQTRSVDSLITSAPPPCTNLPGYAGIFVQSENSGCVSCTTIDMQNTEVLGAWLQS